jgi:hypothetical protein
MLSKRWHLHQRGVFVLLPQRRNALWHQLLQERRRLHRQEPWAVRLSGGDDPVRERGEHALLFGGPGVWLGMPLGVVVRHGLRLCERYDLDQQQQHQQQLVVIVIDKHINEHQHVNVDNRDVLRMHGCELNDVQRRQQHPLFVRGMLLLDVRRWRVRMRCRWRPDRGGMQLER